MAATSKNLESLKDSSRYLDLSNSNLRDGAIPNDVWCSSSLEALNLRKNNFHHIPAAITQLCKLRYLDISHCKMLEGIPELPLTLRYIDAHDCTSLETLSSSSSLLWPSLLQWFKLVQFQVRLLFNKHMKHFMQAPDLHIIVYSTGSTIVWKLYRNYDSWK